MSPMQSRWNELCARLGVKPKQFVTLLEVLAVAVGGLAVKAMLRPRAAEAGLPVMTASAPAPAAPAPTSGDSHATGASAVPQSGVRRVIECALENVPARDPFRTWGLPEPVAADTPAATPASDAEPGVLPGLPLRAVLRGELAVFGDQTVRPGESVALPDGSFARVRRIGDRTVAVEWNGRRLDVMFGSGNATAKAPAAGGFK